MKKVEFTEEVKLGTQTYVEGDVKSFPDDEAAEYIRLGWAKDPETGESGERVPGASPLTIQPVVQTVG